jgi:mono/diheme cytochrome c family protein
MARKKEKDVLLDHSYDGIQELDNDLPPWWLWMFYITIIWAVLYMIYYHVMGAGDLSAEEYMKEMNPGYEKSETAGFSIGYSSPFYQSDKELTPLRRIQIKQAEERQAAIKRAEQQARREAEEPASLAEIGFNELIQTAMQKASSEDLEKLKNAFPDIYKSYQTGQSGSEAPAAEQVEKEETPEIEPLTDKVSLASGESIFLTNCATCHGKQGEGGIGPNMTDDYYLHGGRMTDIVKTITNGVPAKGMIAWRGILNEKQIKEVGSYLITLRGTSPPNAKAPQGEKMAAAVK